MTSQHKKQDPEGPSASRSRRATDDEDHATERREHLWSSRLLHRVGDATSLATVGLGVGAVTALWLVGGFFVEFPTWWNNVLYTVTSSITLVMVFVLQHTQARQQAATQRKLDEVVRALPTANNRLIAVEEAASDGELDDLAHTNLDHRKEAETETQL
ncbi:low affinity iron permease family protein [Cryobacterium cryoconiti]|nr:low affinity iron permease family protein [Cryobacterium cryoconiti]